MDCLPMSPLSIGKVKSNMSICQAETNKVFSLLKSFKDLRKLGLILGLIKVLISRRLLFKNISKIPKGPFPKVKEAMCNVPIETINISSLFPY